MRKSTIIAAALLFSGCQGMAPEQEARLRGAAAALEGRDPRQFETELLTVKALRQRYPSMTVEEATVIARSPDLAAQYLAPNTDRRGERP